MIRFLSQLSPLADLIQKTQYRHFTGELLFRFCASPSIQPLEKSLFVWPARGRETLNFLWPLPISPFILKPFITLSLR